MAEPPSGNSGRGRMYLPPVFWAAFAWLFVICLTQVDGATFYALVRGVGAVEFSDAIVVGSRALDFGLLAVVTLMVGWVPLSAGGWRWGSDPVRLGSLALMLVGLVTAMVYSSPFAFLPLGLGALLLFAVDVRGLADYHEMPVGRSVALTALFWLAVLAVVAVVGDFRWVVGGFDGSTPFSDPSWSFSFAGLQIIALLDPILPEITLLMLFGWVAWLLLPLVSRSAKGWLSAGYTGEGSLGVGVVVSRRASFAMLGAAVLTSVFVGAYPYLHAVNPNSLIVGVDPRYCYSRILGGLPGQGYPCGGAATSYYYTHYGMFVLLQAVSSLGGSQIAAFELAFPLLAVLLTLSTYVFINEGMGNRLAAGVGALFASCSLQIVAGINAGFLANWFALSFALLFFAAVLRTLRTRSVRYLAIAGALSLAVLFIHVWTWALSLGVLGFYLILSLADAGRNGRLKSMKIEVLMVASLIFVVLVADAVRSLLPFGSGLEVSMKMALPTLSLTNAAYVMQNLKAIFLMSILGGFADTLWYVLGVVGVLTLMRMKKDFAMLLASWVVATSVALVFSASPDPDALPIRFLYMLPLQVLGAIGVFTLAGGFLKLAGDGLFGERGRTLLFIIALGASVGLMLVSALDNAGFVYRGIPGT